MSDYHDRDYEHSAGMLCYMYFDESAACISRLKVMNKFVGRKFLQNLVNYPTNYTALHF